MKRKWFPVTLQYGKVHKLPLAVEQKENRKTDSSVIFIKQLNITSSEQSLWGREVRVGSFLKFFF